MTEILILVRESIAYGIKKDFSKKRMCFKPYSGPRETRKNYVHAIMLLEGNLQKVEMLKTYLTTIKGETAGLKQPPTPQSVLYVGIVKG